jgi:hypothetical protein
VVNPRIGSGLQDGRGVVEEEAVEVVRNHEDGTRMGTGIPIPKGKQGRSGHAPAPAPGRRTPRRTYDGGAIFGQLQERKLRPDRWSCKDRNASGIGAKVRRVADTLHCS